jgi:hypothetical protein
MFIEILTISSVSGSNDMSVGRRWWAPAGERFVHTTFLAPVSDTSVKVSPQMAPLYLRV